MLYKYGREGIIGNYERFHFKYELDVPYEIQVMEAFYKEKALIAEYFTLLCFIREELTTWWQETTWPCTCKGKKSSEQIWEEYTKKSSQYLKEPVTRGLNFQEEVHFTHLVPQVFTDKQRAFLKVKLKLQNLATHLLTT